MEQIFNIHTHTHTHIPSGIVIAIVLSVETYNIDSSSASCMHKTLIRIKLKKQNYYLCQEHKVKVVSIPLEYKHKLLIMYAVAILAVQLLAQFLSQMVLLEHQ